MTAFACSYKTSTKNFQTIPIVERLRRLCSEDPMLLAVTIGIVGLIGMFCLFAMAAMATLFGADAFGDFLRDAGQQVGGAGGVGAAGAAGAGGATRAERDGLPRDYTTNPRYGYYPNFRSPNDQRNYGIPPTVERNGKLYVKQYFNGGFQGWREAYRVEGGHGFVDPGIDPPADLLGIRG